MERIVKTTGSFKTTLELDGVTHATVGLHKWWKSDVAYKKDNQIFALLTKDKFWKFDLSFSNDEGVQMAFKSKMFKGIKLHSKAGKEYSFKKAGVSENRLSLLNEQGEEVLVMEKQGKWWKYRPYLVTYINQEDLPINDELLPLVIVSAMRIFNQRAALIAPAVILLNIVLNEL